MSFWKGLAWALSRIGKSADGTPAVVAETPAQPNPKSDPIRQPPIPLDAVVIPPMPDQSKAPVMRWGVPSETVDLSEAFEGFRGEPYRCEAGVWTIGFGSTRDGQGRAITAATPAVSKEVARHLAMRDLERAASLMTADFPRGLPPRWWAVGILMCNNLGRMSVWGPTLMRQLQAGAWREAAHQMRQYRNAAGKPSLGLRRRRWAEAAFALGMEAGEAKRRAWATIKTADDWPPLP